MSPVFRRVCMFVFNDFRNDSRVLKEARTLAVAGHDVRVVALHKPGLPGQQEMEGFEVIRLALDPWHLRLLRWLKGGKRDQGRRFGVVLSGHLKTMLRKLRSLVGGMLMGGLRVAHAVIPRPLRNLLSRLGVTRQIPSSGLFRLLGKTRDGLRRAAMTARLAAYRLALALVMPWHRLFSYLDFYHRAHLLLAANPAQVYHAHDLNTLPIACWLGRDRHRCVVYDSHELYVDRNRLPPRSWLGKLVTRFVESLLIARVDVVITVNDSIAEILSQRYGIPRPTVIMNAPDANASTLPPGTIDLRDLSGASREHHLLLYAGGITFNRGLETLITSLVRLPTCHLILLGRGGEEMLDELRQQARARGVHGRVSFLDPVPPDRVSLYAASADVGVAPIENACLSYYLCSPNKLFEYLHAGLPVAASDFPELRRVIRQHDCGRTFDPSDPRDVADCLRHMLEDPDLLRTMGRNAQKAAASYTWAREGGKLVDCYVGLVEHPQDQAPDATR